MPVAEAHQEYADALMTRFTDAGFRVEVDPATDPLGKRVRNGKVQKVPYVLVVGDDDVANDTVGVNKRGVKDVDRDVAVATFIEQLAAEVDAKS